VSVSNPDMTHMTLSAWRDNGVVKILSTVHSHENNVVKINRRVGVNVVSVDAPTDRGGGGGDLAVHTVKTTDYCRRVAC
jgi:hypothetical protein